MPDFTPYLRELWEIILELSPSLLFGLLIASALHVFLPKDLIRRRLSASTNRSVLEAVLIGVPLPLCSCGVVPTAIGLHREGASRGAATGFLISTSQTGVDAIFVSAAFLGWPFALFKVAAAFVTGLLGGWLVNSTERYEAKREPPAAESCEMRTRPWWKELLHYGLFDLLAAIDIHLIYGVALAALVGVLVPPGYLAGISWTQGLGGMFLVLAIAMPLYVCTTSSVPLAASLIGAGLPLGSALVFLMAGPATNIATMGMVGRAFGARVLAIYLATIGVMSMLFGLVFDWTLSDISHVTHAPCCTTDPSWWELACAALLLALLAFLIGRRAWKHLHPKKELPMSKMFKVDGMSCQHCVARVRKIALDRPGVTEAEVDLDSGRLSIIGNEVDEAALCAELERAGYAARPLSDRER